MFIKCNAIRPKETVLTTEECYINLDNIVSIALSRQPNCDPLIVNRGNKDSDLDKPYIPNPNCEHKPAILIRTVAKEYTVLYDTEEQAKKALNELMAELTAVSLQ